MVLPHTMCTHIQLYSFFGRLRFCKVDQRIWPHIPLSRRSCTSTCSMGPGRVINLNVVYCDIIAIKGKLNNICHSKNIKRHRLNGKVILKGLSSCYTKKQWFSIILGWQTKVIPLNLSQPTWFIFKIKN